MVPLVVPPALEAPPAMRRLARDAVDLSLKRTLTLDDDPFGLAVLLWACVRHREQLVNLDALVAWARDYSRGVIIDGRQARKRDEAVTAALLGSAALACAAALRDVELAQFRDAARALLTREVDPGRVPFDSPAYGAAIAVACAELGVELPGSTATLRAIAGTYRDGARLDRPAGLDFVADALGRAGLVDEVHELYDRALSRLHVAGLPYDARVYLAQAVWTAAQQLGVQAEQQAAATIAEALADTPLYDVLATGRDTVDALGSAGELTHVSRLYLASMYDLSATYERQQSEIIRRDREARYSTTRGHAWLAFVGVAVILLGPFVLITALAFPLLSKALDVYLRQQFWAATDVDRISSAIVAVTWYGLLVSLATILYVAFGLARRRVVSDAHLVDEVRRLLPGRLWRYWVLGFLAAGAVAILWNLTSASLQSPSTPVSPTVVNISTTGENPLLTPVAHD